MGSAAGVWQDISTTPGKTTPGEVALALRLTRKLTNRSECSRLALTA